MNLTDPRFADADKARAWFEAQRWPHGPYCPHCGNAEPDRIKKLQGKAHRPGLYQCAECREQFTVTVGTVMERSKIPLNKWLAAMHMMAASKKGVSAHQLHRQLGITYQSAWFLAHRIREAMKDDVAGPLGGVGAIVEVDELYIGKRETPIPYTRKKYTKPTKRGLGGPAQKRVVIGLVERGGQVRTFHIDHATAASVRDIVVTNVSRESVLHTDESRLYTVLGAEFDGHRTVHHASGEYARYEAGALVTTNTVENVFSVLRRGMKGVYQHCGEAHLHRYLAEFTFRYNRRSALGVTDAERACEIAKQTGGKRLTYRRTGEAAHA